MKKIIYVSEKTHKKLKKMAQEKNRRICDIAELLINGTIKIIKQKPFKEIPTPEKALIIKTILKTENSFTIADIEKKTKCGYTTVLKATTGMIEDKLIIRLSVIRKKRQVFKYLVL
jgi:hypothetical protein